MNINSKSACVYATQRAHDVKMKSCWSLCTVKDQRNSTKIISHRLYFMYMFKKIDFAKHNIIIMVEKLNK